MMNKPLVFLIPFRKGSKGCRNKNIKPLNGVPLFQHAVNQACVFDDADVFISTDYSEAVLDIQSDIVNYISRPESLCSDSSTMSEVILDFITSTLQEQSTIVLLQPTSPLRIISDIQKSIDYFKKNNFDLVMTVSEVDRSVLKYGMINDGIFIPLKDPQSCFMNRQDLPKTFKPNGMVYVFDSDAFVEKKGFPVDSIGAFVTPPERAIDIDVSEDFAVAEAYLKMNLDR